MKIENLEILKRGGVGVLATDTIYGLVGQAENCQTVERLYDLKERKDDKPFIILIANVADLEIFGVEYTLEEKGILLKYWPGALSVVASKLDPKFSYLKRGGRFPSFRLPNKKDLIEVLKQTGPLVAPSANLIDQEPARNIEMAKQYFGNRVDFYEDSGEVAGEPSTVIEFIAGKIKVWREGAVRIEIR